MEICLRYTVNARDLMLFKTSLSRRLLSSHIFLSFLANSLNYFITTEKIVIFLHMQINVLQYIVI